MKTVLVLSQDSMGHGDHELGRKILATFLRKAIRLRGLSSVLLYNGGVKLLAPDSPFLAELRELEEEGIDLLPCGTCLEHFGLTPAAGRVSNMDEILDEIRRAEKVVTL
ncbi:MAG: DsrE family protein [Planctomycetota bacterium]